MRRLWVVQRASEAEGSPRVSAAAGTVPCVRLLGDQTFHRRSALAVSYLTEAAGMESTEGRKHQGHASGHFCVETYKVSVHLRFSEQTHVASV